MQIDEYWRIEADANSWNLIYEGPGGNNPRTGEQGTSRVTYYHGQLEYALKQYLDESLKDAPDVRAILSAIDKASERIVAFCADKTWATLKLIETANARHGRKTQET